MKTTLTALDSADFIGPAPSDDDADGVSDDAESVAEEPQTRFTGPRVKLEVEVDAETFDGDIDAAFRKLATQVRIPGFRPGRAPRPVLESHFGAGVGRAQALEDALPRYYAEAVREHLVDVVNQPELELTSDGSDGPVAFEATVEVRPVVSVSGYDELKVTIPDPMPTPEAIEARIDDIRRQFADLNEVDRPAAVGDRVRIDIEGSVNGEALPGLSAQDYLYELGSGGIVEQVDAELGGCSAGDVLSFSAPHPAQPELEIDFEISVGAVSELVLPELTDEWVDDNTEHDTADELRTATERQISFGLVMQANMALREEVQRLLADLVEGPVPDSMVSGAIAQRMSELASGLGQRNMTIESWLEATGQDPGGFVTGLRDDAEAGVRLDLALRAVAAAEGIEAAESDIADEIERIAQAENRSADKLRAEMEDADGLANLKAAICKSKALELASDAAALVSDEGLSIDRADLEMAWASEAAEGDEDQESDQESVQESVQESDEDADSADNSEEVN